ncbi:hypothetical protein ABZ348_23520 [Streptomyces sp. NPDC005963]|uniref:hypothetical protein n=1 Tax=Streptomyces sp. NPDC005963 TaxID=3156721 RepID=UPI0033E23DF2
MNHRSEMFALQSVEGFLGGEELSRLNKIMDGEAAAWEPEIHAAVLPAPALAVDILNQAMTRALPTIQRAMPSIADAASWAYTHLSAGQEIPANLDGILDPAVAPARVGRIGVVISEADEGGRFSLEPPTEEALRAGGHPDGSEQVRVARRPVAGPLSYGSDPSATPSLVRTRWTCYAGPGVAIAYGARLVSGVSPVRRGVLRTFVGDLIDTPLPTS